MAETYTGDEGDDALADGIDVLDGTEDRRDGWLAINKTRDEIALRAPSSASAWTAAANAAAARAALGVQDTVDEVNDAVTNAEEGKLLKGGSSGRIGVGTPTVSGHAANKGYVDQNDNSVLSVAQDALNGLLNSVVYNRDITSTRRATWTRSDGTLGYASSQRSKKRDIRDAEFTLEQLLAIPVVLYRYRAAVDAENEGGERAATEIGTIADDLHDLGLWQFVVYEGRGEDAVPVGVHYEILALAALSLGQQLHALHVADALRIETLESTVAELVGRVTALEAST